MPTRRTFDKAEFLPNDNSTPHIVPDVLYPAIGGKLLDGTTSHSGNYGTSQTDSRKYYYTDIKGSRPIRDPRIGAHFGSQRYKLRSLQLLEQETANHGANVFSIDGREYLRAVSGTSDWVVSNNAQGNYIFSGDLGTGTPTAFIEIVAYGNLLNMSYVWTANTSHSVDRFDVYVDGVLKHDSPASSLAIVDPPGNTRYVNTTPFLNLIDEADSVSCEVHTFKMLVAPPHQGNSYAYVSDIELIAQDTTNAVTRNKIQIPSQTVFSFGSKFTVGGSSAARHYDPFSAKSDGTGWTSPTSGTNTPNSSAAWPSNIDTATSLGLAKWVDGTNYYRPYNGGRVVNWVDENGEIKTSVNVMPPNAKSIADSGTLSNATAKSNGSAPNDNFRPTFEAHTSSIDEDLLSEVAKTFHFREFGNGSANGNANYLDPTTLTSSNSSDRAYVMDDGLTSFSGDDANVNATHGLWLDKDNGSGFITFIGTGVSWDSGANGKNTWAQNLPYGTHVVQYYSGNQQSTAYYAIDGVQVKSGFDNSGGNYVYNWGFGGVSGDITFHQPKMPPIPEGACIIADYMLMADFVPMSSAGIEFIPKGVRFVAQSRDYKIDYTAGSNVSNPFKSANPVFRTGQYFWYKTSNSSGDTYTQELPFFGDSFVCHFATQSDSDYANPVFTLNGSALSGFTNTGNGSGFTSVTAAGVVTETGNAGNDNVVNFKAGAGTLGSNVLKVSVTSNAVNKYLYNRHFSVATPIHTSHHYKSFETPFLHELIGGDRNMEQTHLICSADGKTWDEVTRDTSYMGPSTQLIVASDGGNWNNSSGLTDHRGYFSRYGLGNKNIAWGYDRAIILEDGVYEIHLTAAATGGANADLRIQRNNTTASASSNGTQYFSIAQDRVSVSSVVCWDLIRGDYIYLNEAGSGTIYGGNQETGAKFIITKVN